VTLGILAIAGSFASAYASSGAATPVRATAVRTSVRSTLVRRQPACKTLALGVDEFPVRVDRALASMVAPTRTVRLASPLKTTPPLHADGYVFPLAGRVSFADTFGAARADVSWHHGDDLFAPRGTTVLAVADGVIFSVGWQRLGGRRLWLRDRAGNEFYYAHLDGYLPKARNGGPVQAGEPIAFVGNSGDAEPTAPHLHFEIHPASLLGLGYDGAVDPTSYLRSWRTLTRPAAAGVARRTGRPTGCRS
jgi:murein DD-endopeptidase MepM/ murein hydrolase activator NlpD